MNSKPNPNAKPYTETDYWREELERHNKLGEITSELKLGGQYPPCHIPDPDEPDVDEDEDVDGDSDE